MKSETSPTVLESGPLACISHSSGGSTFDPSVILAKLCQSCPLRREQSILRAEKGYWQSMYHRAKEREAHLQADIKELQAKLKLREQQLFGRKTEQDKGDNEHQTPDTAAPRKRGQQRGKPGHGRKRHVQLPVKEEVHDLPAAQQQCPRCGLPYAPFPGTEDSEMVEVHVSAHVRRIKRTRYKRQCSCPALPVIITAPGPAKLIPKGAYGDSVWIEVLLDKFLFYRPTHRFLKSLKLVGVEIAHGTITDGLQRVAPLLTPVYQAITGKNQQEPHLHADETRWLVFEEVHGKVGYRWYVWVFRSASTTVYILDPSRSSSVPKTHLKEAHDTILSVDRYSAYKALAKEQDGSVRLAYCWTHMRRDFLTLAKTRPDQDVWAMEWVAQIKMLYHLNNHRVTVLEDPKAFAEADTKVRAAVAQMKETCDEQLRDTHLLAVRRKVLTSLKNHWAGLLIFVDHPEVPMDNNVAERALRGPVVGRKNFYGSGASWSGELAVMAFSTFQTLRQWDVNQKTWLERFFRACAENDGNPLMDVSMFLPWNMSAETLESYRRAPPATTPKNTE